MSNSYNRRRFLSLAPLGAAALVTGSISAQTDAHLPDSVRAVNESFGGDKGPVLDPAEVQRFVRLSHFDFESVQSMLEERPQLVHASWDWGNGDFETGLGAASHVGNVKIAEYLIANGARINLFALTMLGQTAAVKAIVTAHPESLMAKGPHGLGLLHPARKGGERAAGLLEWLTEQGAE